MLSFADGVVDAVLPGVPLKAPDAGASDLQTGYAPVLPQQAFDALLPMRASALLMPQIGSPDIQQGAGGELGRADA